MWKRNDTEATKERVEHTPVATSSTPMASATPSAPAARRTATIGPSIIIKGDITGEEDLVIEGRVKGVVQLPQHNVTVGASGRVEADIHGKRICVDGEVQGDLVGQEVVIRKSGKVEGNATAPRVTLENGCNFRGSIDMQPSNQQPGKEKKSKEKKPSSETAPRKRSETAQGGRGVMPSPARA